MLDKLKDIEKRFEAVNQQLCDPATAQDVKKTTELLKELKTLQPIVEKLREYEKHDSDARQAKELLETPGLEKELRELAQEEWDSAEPPRRKTMKS